MGLSSILIFVSLIKIWSANYHFCHFFNEKAGTNTVPMGARRVCLAVTLDAPGACSNNFNVALMCIVIRPISSFIFNWSVNSDFGQ